MKKLQGDMESPPHSASTFSEGFILSDDSGLLLTNSSISSSGSSRNDHLFEDSDCDDRSLSQDSSDVMSSENFNTLKKGPHWIKPIEPPLEFQDKPIENYSSNLALKIVHNAMDEVRERKRYRTTVHRSHLLGYYASEFISFSPCHGRPSSRCSLGSSRLSSSHNSLSVPAAHKVDDSSFITQAVSHDTLSSNQISDLYNVPFDSDVYAVPVDTVKPKPKRIQTRKKRRYTSSGCREYETRHYRGAFTKRHRLEKHPWCLRKESKRHSLAGTSTLEAEPIHMTLQEVRHYLQTLYSSSSDSSDPKERVVSKAKPEVRPLKDCDTKVKKNTFLINIKNKKVKDSCDNKQPIVNKSDKRRKVPAKLFSFKQTLCNLFGFRRFLPPDHVKCDNTTNVLKEKNENFIKRALPPLPSKVEEEEGCEQALDFATNIQRVKDYGWYWGPLSGEVAEKILSNEPDGSFIVRDSSDDHYIFSLTFKLNNCVRHVRIDHDQGNFSFGSCTKFKSQTIVEFIENAVEHSRSGRYLFFLHRRPVIGPVRVQLLHPVSRFKQVQSLQHICRFVIHKVVRRDLIPSLPLPRRMIDYLNTPHYYSEHLVDVEDTSTPPQNPTPAIRRDYEEVPVVPLNNYIVLNNTTISRQSS